MMVLKIIHLYQIYKKNVGIITVRQNMHNECVIVESEPLVVRRPLDRRISVNKDTEICMLQLLIFLLVIIVLILVSKLSLTLPI